MKVTTNGTEINCQFTGKRNGEVVVLSHSLGSSLIMWQPQLEVLESDFRVLRYDTRGHGNSAAPPRPYTMEMLVSDAIGLLDTLSIEKVHWVGLSMGGMIGQGLAIEAPHRLTSVTLCNTMSVVRKSMKQIWQNRIKTGERFGMHHLVDFTMERWFTESFRASQPKAYLDIRQQFLRTSVRGYIGCCQAIYNLDYEDRLAQITVPTHIIAGDQDLATPLAESRVMHEKILGSSLEVIEGAAHLSNVEKAQNFNQSLVSFLRSQ